MLSNKEKELAELFDKFLEDKPETFDQIAVLIHQDIINIAYRYLNNLEDAKDVLQEVLIKLYRRLAFFRKKAKVSTWIYRVVVNTAIDFIRQKKRGYGIKDRYKKEDRQEKGCLGDVVDLRDKQNMIAVALLDLPRRQKSVFILKHYEGLTINKISEVLGCSESAVKTHLSRAVQNLQKKIGGL